MNGTVPHCWRSDTNAKRHYYHRSYVRSYNSVSIAVDREHSRVYERNNAVGIVNPNHYVETYNRVTQDRGNLVGHYDNPLLGVRWKSTWLD